MLVKMADLPKSIQNDIRAFVTDNPRLYDGNPFDPNSTWGLADVLDAYLQWHGIHGLTRGIMSIVGAAHDENEDRTIETAFYEGKRLGVEGMQK